MCSGSKPGTSRRRSRRLLGNAPAPLDSFDDHPEWDGLELEVAIVSRQAYTDAMLELGAHQTETLAVPKDLPDDERTRALVEGWTAVNTDPTDFSAHRLLADSYQVTSAFTGEQGIEIIRDENPDVVPLDINSAQHRRPGGAQTDQGHSRTAGGGDPNQ